MLKGRKIPIKGYRFKDGKLVRCDKHLDASTRIKRRSKVTYKRGKCPPTSKGTPQHELPNQRR